MKLFEVFFNGQSVIVEAQNERSARFRAATLIKLFVPNVNPYSLTVWEMEGSV